MQTDLKKITEEMQRKATVCETIALTVGLGEAAIDLTDGLADLADVGSKAGGAVSRALAEDAAPAVADDGEDDADGSVDGSPDGGFIPPP